ncbi:MAG: 2-C-methyl-D-erythritol 4-phosphate cytidylyltransferase [Clostridium sp.]
MNTAIILAAGMGSRMNCGYNKQFIKIDNKEILAHTLRAFNRCSMVDNIVIVASNNEIGYIKDNIVSKYGFNKVTSIVLGGDTRQESVYNGLKSLVDSNIVIIHDGARPFITDRIILESINSAIKYGASTASVKMKDTVKRGSDNFYSDTINRESLYSIQTPQCFNYNIIMECHEKALLDGIIATDDSMVVEAYGHKVAIVEGSYFNIKVTTREDIYIGEGILKAIKEDIC